VLSLLNEARSQAPYLLLFSWELEQTVAGFVAYYNTTRYHEALNNLTPADVFSGRAKEVFTQRDLIKQQTLLERCRVSLRAVHILTVAGVSIILGALLSQ